MRVQIFPIDEGKKIVQRISGNFSQHINDKAFTNLIDDGYQIAVNVNGEKENSDMNKWQIPAVISESQNTPMETI